MFLATKRHLCSLLLIALPFTTLLAQSDQDFMRSLGKMYVVVAVIVAIFIGIVVYLFSLDRKITKLENQIIDQ